VANGNYVRPAACAKGAVVFGPTVYDVPLLPYEKQLIQTIGITEEEYKRFAAEARRRGAVRPAEYDHIPDVVNAVAPVAATVVVGAAAAKSATTVILTNLAIGFVLTGVSYLLTPKPKMPSAARKGGSIDLEGFTGPSRFTPSRGFETLADIADYASPIPIVFGLYDSSDKVGGMLVTPKMVWSRMFSYGAHQQAKMLFVVAEQGLVNNAGNSGIDKPDLEGIFLGNNALDQVFSDQFAFYWRQDTEDGVKRIIGDDKRYGTKGSFASGDPDGPKGNEEVFLCPTRAVVKDTGFCHAFSPVNNTEFGVYGAIANGNAYRLNYQAIAILKGATNEGQKQQIAERIKIIGDQNFGRDNGIDYNGENMKKRVEKDKVTAEGKGRNYSPRMGLFKLKRKNGSEDQTNSDKLRKVVTVEEGDKVVFLISESSIDKNLYRRGGRGPGVDDINSTVRSMQFAADEAMQLGELFSIGGTVWKVTKRSSPRFEPDIIVDQDNTEKDERSQFITLECIDTSTCVGTPQIGLVNKELVIEPNNEDRKGYIDDNPEPGTDKGGNVGESFFPITKVSFATLRNNRPAAVIELGIKSNVFQTLRGLCAFGGVPSPEEIKALGKDNVAINNATYTGSITRSSVFRIFVRKAGQEDEGKGFTFAPLPQFFVVRGSKPVAQYNSIRIIQSSDKTPKELEFKFVAVPGSELRLFAEDFEFCELNNEYDGEDSLRTENVRLPGLGEMKVAYKGKKVPKLLITSNKEFFRGEQIILGTTTINKPTSIERGQELPGPESGTQVEAIQRIRNIGSLDTDDDKSAPGKNGAFSHAIAGSADNGLYFQTPVGGTTPTIRTREFFDNNKWIVIDWTFRKIELSTSSYARSQNNAQHAWVPHTANVVGSSRGFAVGDVVTIKRGEGGTNVYGGDPNPYPNTNPFKQNNPGGTTAPGGNLLFSGRDVQITNVSDVEVLGGRTQGYLYELFGNAENLNVESVSNPKVVTFTKGAKSIKIQFQSKVQQLNENFSGQRKGWTRPTMTVVQDSDTTNNWEAGDTFDHLVTPSAENNPFHNKYGKVGFRYRIGSVNVVKTATVERGAEGFVTTSQLSDLSLYRELVEKSNSSAPEHEIVYVNEILENETVPNFFNLTQAGLSLRASRNFTQLDQLRCWIGRGTRVKRLHPDREQCYGDSKEIGSSNLFTDLVFYLLTDQIAGAGGLLGMKANDAPLVDLDQMIETTRFIKRQKLYFNGPITDRTNLRQFITDLAPNFLCNFIVSDGKFALKPAIPYNPKSGLINLGPVQVEQLFTSGNILEDTFKVEYLRSEERRQFKAIVRYRHEQPNKLPEERSVEVVLKGEISDDRTVDLLPQEQFDLTQFCTSEDHAVKVAKYFIALRKLVTHTINFSTTLEGLNIVAGSYIKVVTEASPYNPANNGTISSSGVITSVEDLADGQYQVSYFHTGSNDVEDGLMTVSNGRVGDPLFHDSVFTLRNDTVSRNIYVVEQLTFSDQGTVDIVASEHPCDDDDRSELASLVTSDSFRIF
jgi:hypothetical protein